MKLGDLNQKHPSYDRECMERYADLFEGGERMRRNVRRHIVRNDIEPDEVYARRCAAAHYVNYCGSIGGYLGSFLFSRPLVITPSDGFWLALREDCDGTGTDLVDFMRALFLEALVKQRAFVRIEFPSPAGEILSLADYQAQGAGEARLSLVPAENIIDWDTDARGEYVWVREHNKRCVRQTTGEPRRTIETWTEWRIDGSARRWQVEYEGDHLPPTEEVEEIDPPFNPTGALPIVSMRLQPDLWLMGHLASPQLEHFRQSVALSWAKQRSCYAMPIIFMEDPRALDTPMGWGYYRVLGAKDRIEFAAPPAAPFQTLESGLEVLKSEIYRVAQVMARGVNNDAAAVGRSGESKQADDRATEIVLTAYAAIVKEVTKAALELIAKGRGEQPPDVGGMDGYSMPDATITIENFVALETVQLHSVTAKREIEKRAMRANLPDLSQEKLTTIDTEIDANLLPEELDTESSAEDMAAQSMPDPLDQHTKAAEMAVKFRQAGMDLHPSTFEQFGVKATPRKQSGDK